MPPTPGGEWAVAHFNIDGMFSNDNHRRILEPNQQYTGFNFTLNGDITEGTYFDLNWVIIWKGTDKEKPTLNGKCSMKRTPEGIEFSWEPGNDNIKVFYYKIFGEKNGERKSLTISTSCQTKITKENSDFDTFYLMAIDLQNNESELIQFNEGK